MRILAVVGLTGVLLFPPTPVAQVAQTSKQVEHSKLFQNYGVKGHKLTDGQGDAHVVHHEEPMLKETLPTRAVLLGSLACQSDAVILGKVVSQTAVLSQDETFIFTDAEISVVEVLKDNSASHIYPNQSITVTRPGGSLQVNGRKLTMRLSHFRDFSIGGQFVFFLRFLPATLDYQAFGDRSFELRDGLIFNLTKNALWDGQQSGGQDGAAAMVDARTAAASPCN